MISTYQRVVSDARRIGYDHLCEMSDAEVREVVGPLGLYRARTQYLKSVRMFVQEQEDKGDSPLEMSNDSLIELFMRSVKGAGYKVAQCAVLYAKGYHCGVLPVDSGMKDMLGPCLGLHLPRGPIAHEIMRQRIEEILNAHPLTYQKLVLETGYGGLAIPESKPPIWWAHLVLIYFKRLYCNRRDPQNCPLRASPRIGKCMGSMCDRRVPQSGGYQYVVVEGIDTFRLPLREEGKNLPPSGGD
jgi:endonuclease III